MATESAKARDRAGEGAAYRGESFGGLSEHGWDGGEAFSLARLAPGGARDLSKGRPRAVALTPGARFPAPGRRL